jgi:hypothetical protein
MARKTSTASSGKLRLRQEVAVVAAVIIVVGTIIPVVVVVHAWIPSLSTTGSRRTAINPSILYSSSSSYEDQYAAFFDQQQQQQLQLQRQPPLQYQEQQVSSLAGDFLGFISSEPSDHRQEHQQQQQGQRVQTITSLYSDMSTSLDFSSFDNENKRYVSTNQDVGFSSPTYEAVASLGLGGSSSYLENLSTPRIATVPPSMLTSQQQPPQPQRQQGSPLPISQAEGSSDLNPPPYAAAFFNQQQEQQPQRRPPHQYQDQQVSSSSVSQLSTTSTTVLSSMTTGVDTTATMTLENNNNNNKQQQQQQQQPQSADTSTSTTPKTKKPAKVATATRTKTKSKTITVQVDTILPAEVTIRQAKNAWYDYCWSQGGGIMIPTFSAADDDDDGYTYSKGIIPKTREFLVPYGLKQELVLSDKNKKSKPNDGNSNNIISYRTTRRGPFWQDIAAGSHQGTVEFMSEKGNDKFTYSTKIPPTRMVWTITFQVEQDEEEEEEEEGQQNANNNDVQLENFDFTNLDYSELYNTRVRYVFSKEAFWKAWTKFQLQTATQNFKSYLKVPSNIINIDHTERMPAGVTPRQAMDAWYEYVWRGGGGGSTIVPPVMFRQGRQRWIVPAFLEEEIVSMDYDESHSIIYRVNNPNLFTYPVHNHQSKVWFTQENDNTPTKLLWNVQVQPYRKLLVPGVYFWTKSSMVLASRNLRIYLEGRQEQLIEENRIKQEQAQMAEPSSQKKQRLFPFPSILFGSLSSERSNASKPSRSTLMISQPPRTIDPPEKKQNLFPFPNLPFGPSSSSSPKVSTVSASPRSTLVIDDKPPPAKNGLPEKKRILFSFPQFPSGTSSSSASSTSKSESSRPSSNRRRTLIIEKPLPKKDGGRGWFW